MRVSTTIAIAALIVTAASGVLAQDAENAYTEARRALNRLEFDAAIAAFQGLRRDFPESRYVGDSYYWEAFALERRGDLESAVEVIDTLLREYPGAAVGNDARDLRIRACMELERRGDRECAFEEVRSAVRAPGDVDEAMRLAAVNALIYLPAERAVPIAAQLVANRDQPLEVRKQALFILADMAHEPVVSAQVREALKAVALDTTDDLEMREQAVFWLSEAPGGDTLAILEELVNSSADPDLQVQAVFAISQQPNAESVAMLQKVALNDTLDAETRLAAIHWIGERGGPEALPFLTRIYAEIADVELKETVLFAVAQTGAPGATAWLVARSGDATEPVDIRQQALFQAAEAGLPLADLKAIYERSAEPELRGYAVWLIAERGSEGLDTLLEIARTDPDPAMREQAISWIGTSGDPRAEEYLLQILGQ